MSRASFVALALVWLTAALPDARAMTASAAVPDFPSLPAGDLPVGYRVAYLQDVSRSFGPRTDLDGQPLPGPLGRPVQFHLWYPARPGGGTAMRCADYVRASVAPTGSAPDDSAAAARALESCRERPLRRGADPARLEAWLERPALARRDAPPAEGRFPLVVYAPSINSDPWENWILVENLASRGFVVASAPSVGEDEAAVSIDAAGSHAQQDDLRFVLARALDDPSVDPRRVGMIGFSWGGMNAVQLALRHAGVSAVVNLDGAHVMPDYKPIAESFPWWNPRRLRAALLEIVPRGAGRDTTFTRDSLYADTYRWELPGIGHNDFAADMIARYRVAAADTAAARVAGTWEAMAARIATFLAAYLQADAAALTALRQGRTAAPGSSPPPAGAPWWFRPALPAPPTAAQFDQLVEERGVDEAVRVFRAARAADAGAIVFERDRLLKFGPAWGPERGGDLEKLLRLNLEVYPDSAPSHFWLAQVCLARDDPTAAVGELETALRLDPGYERAQRLLRQLKTPSAR